MWPQEGLGEETTGLIALQDAVLCPGTTRLGSVGGYPGRPRVEKGAKTVE